MIALGTAELAYQRLDMRERRRPAIPWPRLKICGRPLERPADPRNRRLQRAPPASKAPKDRDCPAERLGGRIVLRAQADRPRCRAQAHRRRFARRNHRGATPTPFGKPITLASVRTAASRPATIRLIGATHQRSIRSAARRQPSCRKSAPPRRRLRSGGEIVDRPRRQAGRSAAETAPARDRRKAAPAPDPACHGRRSYSSRRSKARRKSR